MTRKEIENTPELVDFMLDRSVIADSRMKLHKRLEELCKLAIKALEQESCGNDINVLATDAISRQAVLDIDFKRIILTTAKPAETIEQKIKTLPSVTPQTKTWHCKDCKWWKDSDGAYRRGLYAESQCPINRRKVFEGNGYCYMFAPQESEK